MNELEAASLFGQKKEVEEYAKSFSERFDTECIITLSPKSLLANSDGLYEINALKIEAIDTVGAGDMFIGAFSASLYNGDNTLISLQATVASGLACKFEGAQPVAVTYLTVTELHTVASPD